MEAWQNHADGEALLHLTLGRAHDDRQTSGLEAMALHIGAAVREGLVPAEEASRIYLTAWAFSHAFLKEPDLADWFLMRRESLLPGERFPSVARITARTLSAQVVAAASCLLAATQIEENLPNRAKYLLRLEFISTPSVAPSFSKIRDAIDSFDDQDSGARLALVLCELDRLLIQSDAHEKDTILALCDDLTAQVRDVRSRELLQFRKLYVQSESNPAEAFELLHDFDSTMTRSTVLEISEELIYLKSLAKRDVKTASKLALSRAHAHSDLRFAYAWAVRGLTMMRDADRSLETIEHEASLILKRCERLKRDAPMLFESLQDFAVGAALHSTTPENAIRMSPDAVSLEYDLLRTMFWLDDAEVPAPSGRALAIDPTLRAFFASRAAELPGLSLHHELFEDWGDSSKEFVLSQYVSYFALRSVESVWERGIAYLEDADEIEVENIWVLWAAARDLGFIEEFIDRLIPFKNKGTTTARLHCTAALAEALAAINDKRGVTEILTDFPDGQWADSIRRRADASGQAAAETDAWSVIVETRELVPDASDVSGAIESARQHIRAGQPRRAARGFFEASKLTDDREVQGRLMYMAARSIEEADAFSERAVELYRRALDFNPQLSRALSRLLALLARKEQWRQLIVTARDRGASQLGADSRFILEEAALQVASSDPNTAYDGWELALGRIAMSDGSPETLERFEKAGKAAFVADRLDDFDQLLQALIERFGDTAIGDSLARAERRFQEVQDSLEDPITAIVNSQYDSRVVRIAAKRLREEYSHVEVADQLNSLQPDTIDGREALVEEIIFLIDASDLSAAERIERIDALEATSKNPWLGIAKANAYGMLDQFDKAASVLETAARRVEHHVDRAEIYRQLGKLYEDQLMNSEVALENYLVSFICDSGNAATLQRLEDMYQSRARYGDLAGAYDVAISHIAERNPSELTEATLRAKRAQIFKNHAKDPKGLAEDIDWLRNRTAMPRKTLNLIIQHLAEDLGNDRISAWVSRLDVALDDSSSDDQVARWHKQAAS